MLELGKVVMSKGSVTTLLGVLKKKTFNVEKL
jgi:hypothetical protein